MADSSKPVLVHQEGAFGKKTIGMFAGVVLLINNITGGGMVHLV